MNIRQLEEPKECPTECKHIMRLHNNVFVNLHCVEAIGDVYEKGNIGWYFTVYLASGKVMDVSYIIEKLRLPYQQEINGRIVSARERCEEICVADRDELVKKLASLLHYKYYKY